MVIGLACRVNDSQPHVGLVILEEREDEIKVKAEPLRPSRHHDLAQQLQNLAADLETRLSDLTPDAIVVATMERWGGGQRKPHEPSTRLRLRVEGVLLATARRHIDGEVLILTGQQIGQICGSNKETVIAEAASLVGRRDELIEACAAALAGLAHVRTT